MGHVTRRIGALLAAMGAATFLATAPVAQQPPVAKNLQVLPKTLTADELTSIMRAQAMGLGVKCDFCHIKEDASSDVKPKKLRAREMMRMVKGINEGILKDSKVKVACFTCHQGKPEPAPPPPLPSR